MYAIQQKVQLLVDELTAYEKSPEIRSIAPVHETSISPAASDDDHEILPAEALPYYVEDLQRSLPGGRLPTAARKLWHTLIGSSRDLAEEARDHAGKFADWLVANYLSKKRLIIDTDSGIVVLDGLSDSGSPPEALAIMKFLQDHPGQKFSTKELQQKIPGIKGESKVKDVLKQIKEPAIRECIKGQRGSGRWLELPQRPF